MDLVLATRNVHKTREFQRILGADFIIQDLTGYSAISEIAETGRTFEENAALKAASVSKEIPGLVVADDSGLEVDALGSAPGIYSARYAGKNATDKENIDKLLRELKRVGSDNDIRTARFHCVLAVAREGRLLETFEGVVEGKIVDAPRGNGGFGYDPLFAPNGFNNTFGELSASEKDQISHRARALEKLRSRFSA